jgi:hypothetical protein
MKKTMDDYKTVSRLVSTDRIEGIKETMVAESVPGIKEVPACQIHPTTRFYLATTALESTIAQKPFVSILAAAPSYVTYYDERTPDRKLALDAALALTSSPATWSRFVKAHTWFAPYEHANKITSDVDTSMSAYLPIVQALRNELNAALDSLVGGGFDTVLGAGAAAECVVAVKQRFNMDGQKPVAAHGKVGLLDEWQIWAWMVDPHARELQPTIVLEKGLAYHLRRMLGFFVPDDDDDLSNAAKDTRKQLKSEFMLFHTQQGPYIELFDDERPAVQPNAAELQKTLTLDDISKWDKESGPRLLWWDTFYPMSPLYLTIAKPLLSARTVGSIAVERVAKPLKNKVMSKERNQLGVGRAEVLLRAGMNLRLLNKHKSMMQEMGLLVQ